MTQSDPATRRLKKTVLVLTCVFLLLLCVVTGLLLSLLVDVRQQVAELREHTGQMAKGLGQVEQALAKGVRQLPINIPEPLSANEQTAGEIAHLLDCVGQPELRYEYEDKQRAAEWVQMKLKGKAVLFGGKLASAEDFIDNVAAKTSEGALYYVIDKAGKKSELRVWLAERLQEYRSR